MFCQNFGTCLLNKWESNLQRLCLWVGSYLNMHVSKFCLMKQLNLLLSKKVIAAVDVSNVKVHFILCYWACVLYATHMINVDPSSRKPGSIQETKNVLHNQIMYMQNLSKPWETRAGKNLLRVHAHIVYKFWRNSLMCPWEFWRSQKSLGVFHNNYY